MSSLRRPLLLVAAILLVPLVPVLVLGLSFEDRITAWIEATPLSPAMRFSLIVALLGIDIFPEGAHEIARRSRRSRSRPPALVA